MMQPKSLRLTGEQQAQLNSLIHCLEGIRAVREYCVEHIVNRVLIEDDPIRCARWKGFHQGFTYALELLEKLGKTPQATDVFREPSVFVQNFGAE